MKVTIVYDNTSFRKELQADWGFSALIEIENIPKILFDVGGSGKILLKNMKKLNIDPNSIEEIFISHAHFDHIGGLSDFLSENNQVKIWAPPSFRGIKNAKEIITTKGLTELNKGVYSTGELEEIEQSLCIKTEKGIVVIVGCSHPKMKNILKAASKFGKVYGIIGGLHGNKPEALKGLDIICATHCTQYGQEIKNFYPKQYSEGGAGRVIEI